VWSTTTRVSDATAVTFSVKCFNLLKLYTLSGNIFRKWFTTYFLYIHEHLIVMLSPTVNLIAVIFIVLSIHPSIHVYFSETSNTTYAIYISTNKKHSSVLITTSLKEKNLK